METLATLPTTDDNGLPVVAGFYQTRGVLAGCYRGRSEERGMLTHLADVRVDGGETALCKGVRDNGLVDPYGMGPEDLVKRPTCKVCGKKWDRLQK